MSAAESTFCPFDAGEIRLAWDVAREELIIRQQQMEALRDSMELTIKANVRSDLVEQTTENWLSPIEDSGMQIEVALDILRELVAWAIKRSEREQVIMDKLHLILDLKDGSLKPDPMYKNEGRHA